MTRIHRISCIDEQRAELLQAVGFETVADVRAADLGDIAAVQGISDDLARTITEQAAEMADEQDDASPDEGADQPPEEFELDPEHHRRLLDIYNEAVAPEDLEEHPIPEITPEEPQALIEYRDRQFPYGFTHVDQLLDPGFIDPDAIPDIDALLPLLNGTWSSVLTPSHPQVTPGSFVPGHAALLHTGEVLILPSANIKHTVIYDPGQNQFRQPGNRPSDVLYCSGHSFLADGKLLVVGGGGGSASNAIDSAWVFDPTDTMNNRQGVWKKVRSSPNGATETMQRQRWYPTCVTLGGGRVLVAGGVGRNGAQQTEMEVYDYNMNNGQVGQFSLVSTPGGYRDFGQYAGLHLLPDGEVFHSRADRHNPTQTNKNALFRFTGSHSGNWTNVQDTMVHTNRNHAMSAQILERTASGNWVAKVLVVGGGNHSTQRTAEIINLSKTTPKWNNGNNPQHNAMQLNNHRHGPNVVLLPTGSAFVCGGMHGTNTPTELFDPDSGTWSQMARLTQERTHHSVAVLLPSGEVMMTGGDSAQNPNSIEIYRPPYMHGGSRPTIDSNSVPSVVHHGSSFSITSPDAASIQEAVLVRPMAVTHFTDTEQRVIPMSFTQSGNTLTITADTGNHPHPVGPRGYYMLFVLDSDGDPSEGEWLFLH
jgi:hypothetical protein